MYKLKVIMNASVYSSINLELMISLLITSFQLVSLMYKNL